MPWYDNQLPVIGGDLIQIDQMKRQNVQDERRNALADIAMQRGEEQYQQQRQDRLTADQDRQARQALAKAKWARGQPKDAVARQFPEITANFEKQTGIPWAQADEGVFQRFTDDSIRTLSGALGEGPEQAQTAEQYTLSPGSARYDSSGRVIAERGYTPRPVANNPTATGNPPPRAPAKPLPIGALRLIDDAKQAIASTGESQALVDRAIVTIESGGVDLGAVENLKSRGKNFAGMSDPNSRAYADIRQTLEKLRNNYLLLAKGVQTEGDAQRAWNSEIGENVQNDNALALQQLRKAKGMIERAITAQNSRIQSVQANYGVTPENAPSGPPSAPKPGQIVKGYRFKGGDPSKPGNWVKAQ